MKINEENFIIHLKNRNEKALEYVIDNYGWIIKSIVRKHLYNLESYQQECINDILLGVWNNINSFNEEKSTFKNWVAGISKYKTIDYRRKYLKELENANLDDLELKVEDNSHIELTKKELSNDLEQMLSCLKNKDRELFIKLYVEDQDIDYISKEMGVKRDVIYNRVSRGKKSIKKYLSFIKLGAR